MLIQRRHRHTYRHRACVTSSCPPLSSAWANVKKDFPCSCWASTETQPQWAASSGTVMVTYPGNSVSTEVFVTTLAEQTQWIKKGFLEEVMLAWADPLVWPGKELRVVRRKTCKVQWVTAEQMCHFTYLPPIDYVQHLPSYPLWQEAVSCLPQYLYPLPFLWN